MLTDKLFSFHISDILKDSNYSLTQFDDAVIEIAIEQSEEAAIEFIKTQTQQP